jgi:ribosomal small subunit protein bTHX
MWSTERRGTLRDPNARPPLSSGDKRTAKGKRKAKSFGISRPRNAELRHRKTTKAE